MTCLLPNSKIRNVPECPDSLLEMVLNWLGWFCNITIQVLHVFLQLQKKKLVWELKSLLRLERSEGIARGDMSSQTSSKDKHKTQVTYRVGFSVSSGTGPVEVNF